MVTCVPRLVARRGMATVEVVLAAGVGLPVAVALMYLGFRMCKYVFQASATLVGSPYL